MACPACAASSLIEFEALEAVRVEFCQSCKGMLVDELALQQLSGASDVEALSDASQIDAGLWPCLRCNTSNWQRRTLAGAARPGLGLCGTCGMVWLEAGELEHLRALILSERRRARGFASVATASGSALPASSESAERAASGTALALPVAPSNGPDRRADRISFDAGTLDRLGVPLALGLSLPFCATPLGQFFAGLIGMPFHELGHALTSWLSSRFAMPLPFFTVWGNDQSWPFGVLVAGSLGWFGHHSWRERSRFGVLMASALLATQLGMSWLVPSGFTLMLQILGGALGELVLAALLLAAFHYPLPDRLRWDFWRWPALLPGAVCFTHAQLIWIRAGADPSVIPWGAAIGDESDGDMNRLVRDFGWSASELASFYLRAGVLSALALAVAYAIAWRRQRTRLI